jgi:hypothetical protein
MSTTATNKNAYGLFYKSHGSFTGPYRNRTFTTLTAAQSAKTRAQRVLKSVVLVRKVA